MSYLCSNPWTTAFIWGNGDVTHCCYSNIGPLGNINRHSLEDIWHGKKANFVRNAMEKGHFDLAGCENFCRVYRWNQLYGTEAKFRAAGYHRQPDIPEGLGRIENFKIPDRVQMPKIVGVSADWKCNFKCSHCQAARGQPGISETNIEKLWPNFQTAEILRFVGGEFTVNRKTLGHIEQITQSAQQPAIFLNTNGHTSISHLMLQLKNINCFRLKFSLEGIGDEYEAIRKGGSWPRFEKNLLDAKRIFDAQNAKGKDWRLYLNLCVMKSNIASLPEIIDYAIDKDIRLVVNTINGMRHIDENIAMWEHLRITDEELDRIEARGAELLDGSSYFFRAETRIHLNYVINIFKSRQKLSAPLRIVKFLSNRIKGQPADRFFYTWYKWQHNKLGWLFYLFRKTRKVLIARIRDINVST